MYIPNSMEAYLRLMVSCSLYTAIIRQIMISVKHPCYQMIIEINIYIYLFIYNDSITNIAYSSNYNAFGLPLTYQVR